ncbi:hypothetical protein [Helicobacter pullorum]|uniref:hypothetical protein n=1 Tax=Helicobacter pullorum TaxID=35818 RepID=UPI0006BAF1FD|nr:hypothetical protein [Helicobacter pullorum]KPH54340.1 hypothetical protein HPU229313_06370 [Helicobacter pullorum]VEJ08071.1 Uncharacterised protein [Helicobacter pullorum]
MTGFLIAFNAKTRQGKIEQAHNKRHYEFDLKVWQGRLDELAPNIEVEFELSNTKEVLFVKPKSIFANENFTIQQTKSIKDCIYDYFGGVENLIKRYQKAIQSNKELDFLRIKRFLFTAYNDLFELDSTIPNLALSNLKSELASLDNAFESFSKKASYPPQYSYEKIFLSKQIQYTKNQELIQTTHSIIKSASIQQASMGKTLKEMEERFANRRDLNSPDYLQTQTSLKSFRKRYVDLLHYLSSQKEKLAKITKAGEQFEEQFYEPFLKSYLPFSKELKNDFIKILNSKAYELDCLLWQRAKQSLSVRRFFIEAGITGTYSSKTFLKYFLKSLDRTKIRQETKSLFDLLKYLETFSKKNILLIQKSVDDSKRYKEYLKNFDNDLNITTSNHPKEILDSPKNTHYDVIVMEWEIDDVCILDFIQSYQKIFNTKEKTYFCAIIPKNLDNSLIQEAKKSQIQYLIYRNNTEQFIDMMRMIL